MVARKGGEELAAVGWVGALAGGPRAAIRRGARLRIGRHADNDLRLMHPSVTRFHAMLVWLPRSGRLAIVDLSSANGTRVDGREVPPNRPVPVRAGARIEVGEAVLELKLVHDDHAALLDGLDDRVALYTDCGGGEQGRLAERGDLADLLLHLGDRGRTGTLTLALPGQARVIFGGGRVMQASFGELSGRSALEALLRTMPGGTLYRFETSVELSDLPGLYMHPAALLTARDLAGGSWLGDAPAAGGDLSEAGTWLEPQAAARCPTTARSRRERAG